MKEATKRFLSRRSVNVGSDYKSEMFENDDSFDWEIELSETDGFNDEDGKLLTSLVRKTYIQHLQRSLLHNYDCWFRSRGDGVELSESFIARCAAQLEKRALRDCMLASLYQHSVIKQIKNIKRSTTQKKLHEDLLISLNSSTKCDKSCQTDLVVSVANLSDSVPTQYPSLITNFNPADVQSSLVSDTPANHSFDDVANLSNILTMKSYLAQPPLSESTPVPLPVPSPFVVPNINPPSKFVFSYLPKTDGLLKQSNLSESSAEVSSSKIYDPEFDSFSEDRISFNTEQRTSAVSSKKRKNKMSAVNDKIFPSGEKHRSIVTSHKSEPSPKRRKSSLDERLKTLEELFGDTCEDVPPEPLPPDKAPVKGNYTKFFSLVSWKQEAIAQHCELNKILLSLPPVQLKSLKCLFKRLFGENQPISDITPEQFTHCRKRLANIIVCQLTPYFDLGQIGSREVFKALAREVTRIILNETYAADMQFSQKTVDEVFQDGVKYKTLDDVNILCSR